MINQMRHTKSIKMCYSGVAEMIGRARVGAPARLRDMARMLTGEDGKGLRQKEDRGREG